MKNKQKTHFINVIGNVGVGTTTLTKKLCKHFGWTYSDSVGHTSPYLLDFYNKGNFAFHNQIYIMTQSMVKHSKLDFSKTICQDYSFFEHHEIYSKLMYKLGYLKKRDLDTLKTVNEIYAQNVKKPDLIIYLRSSLNDLQNRIRKRNRKSEQKIDQQYLQELQKQINRFIHTWKFGEIIIMNTSKINIFSKTDFAEITKEISRNLK